MNTCTAQTRLLHRFDADYVSKLINDSSDTIDHFVEYFRTIVIRILRKHATSPGSIDDICQETLVRALNALKHGQGLRTPECLGAFVISVARNVRREYFRSGIRNSRMAAVDHHISDSAPDPEHLVMNSEACRQVRATLDRLSPKDRQLLVMALAEDRPREDICRALNIKSAHLSVLLYRAKARFRTSFDASRSDTSSRSQCEHRVSRGVAR